ncbi:MAG: hypothetical protein OXH84_05870 [Gammaproteobacteria bacterium]|nr:hypothetical protein [Gammaproteobacteria bacterium]
MSYVIGWMVAVFATGCLALLVYIPLKRHRIVATWLITLGAFWALFPWRIQEDFFAPIFVVFFFRMFLESDADAALVGAIGFLATVGICTIFAVIAILHRVFIYRKKQRLVSTH